MTQSERVLQYLREFGSIDQVQATVDLGCLRLAARVHELRTEGHDIKKDWITVKNRWGEDCRIVRYRLAHVTPLARQQRYTLLQPLPNNDGQGNLFA